MQPSVPSREATLRITRAAAGREDLELREFGVVREVPGYADPLHADPLTQQAIQPAGRHNHEVGIVGDPVDLHHRAAVKSTASTLTVGSQYQIASEPSAPSLQAQSIAARAQSNP